MIKTEPRVFRSDLTGRVWNQQPPGVTSATSARVPCRRAGVSDTLARTSSPGAQTKHVFRTHTRSETSDLFSTYDLPMWWSFHSPGAIFTPTGECLLLVPARVLFKEPLLHEWWLLGRHPVCWCSLCVTHWIIHLAGLKQTAGQNVLSNFLWSSTDSFWIGLCGHFLLTYEVWFISLDTIITVYGFVDSLWRFFMESPCSADGGLGAPSHACHGSCFRAEGIAQHPENILLLFTREEVSSRGSTKTVQCHLWAKYFAF